MKNSEYCLFMSVLALIGVIWDKGELGGVFLVIQLMLFGCFHICQSIEKIGVAINENNKSA